MTITQRINEESKEFKRFQMACSGFTRDQMASAYVILIGVLRSGMPIKEYRKRIDNAIKFVNKEFKKESEINTDNVFGYESRIYTMKGGSHEKKSVA